MTDQEIAKVVKPLLQKHFKSYGLRASTIASAEDFDGGPIIRVTAHFRTDGPPYEKWESTLLDIRRELIAKGENRFVFLNDTSDVAEPADEDID